MGLFNKNIKAESKKLHGKQVRRFYLQELFGDSFHMKKHLFFLVCLIAAGEFIKIIFLPHDTTRGASGKEKIILYISLIVGCFLFSLGFLRILNRNSARDFLIRSSILCLANSCIFVFIVTQSISYFRSDDFGTGNVSIMNGMAFFCSGVYIPMILDLLNPIWFAKLIIPVAYWIALLVGAYQIEGDFMMETWFKVCIGIINVLAITIFKDHFRWKLFEKRIEEEALNKIHEQILDNIPNPIAVFDVNENIVYKNYGFDKLSKNSYETFSKKIVRLKLRREQKDNDESDFTIEQRKNEILAPLSISRPTLSRALSRDPRKLLNYFDGTEIPNLNDLLQKALKMLSSGRLNEEIYVVFDGKLIEEDASKENPLAKKEFSFEVALSFSMEYRRLILMLRDTTLQAKIISLETNNNYKDKLLASVSHELRTPLNGNLSFVEAAMNSEEIPQSLKDQYLVPAFRSGKLLLHLINDILDFSQIAAKKLRLIFDPLPIKDTIENCYQLVELQARKKDIDLKMILDENLAIFSTDHDRLKQIILNLLSNAIKFTFNGSVTLKAKLLSPWHIKIIVKDTGVGIKQENLDKLFKEFTRIEDTGHMNINTKGVGLGLKIAFKLAKRLGPRNSQGGISVKSEYGKGSSFSFVIVDKVSDHQTVEQLVSDQDLSFEEETNQTHTESQKNEHVLFSTHNLISLPSVQAYENTDVESNIRNHTTQPLSKTKLITLTSPYKKGISTEEFSNWMDPSSDRHLISPKRKKKLLVVDDEPFNILAIESFLKRLDVRVESAFNGKEAVEKVIKLNQSTNGYECYDMILMDCQMPVMNGWEATSKLVEMMKKKEIPNIPILACTAFNGKEAIETCYKVGMKEVLKKPLSRTQLQQIVKKYTK